MPRYSFYHRTDMLGRFFCVDDVDLGGLKILEADVLPHEAAEILMRDPEFRDMLDETGRCQLLVRNLDDDTIKFVGISLKPQAVEI